MSRRRIVLAVRLVGGFERCRSCEGDLVCMERRSRTFVGDGVLLGVNLFVFLEILRPFEGLVADLGRI